MQLCFFFFFLLLLLLLPPLISSAVEDNDLFPSNELRECAANFSRICDPQGLLSDFDRDFLEMKIENLERDTRSELELPECAARGIRAGVVVTVSLHNTSLRTAKAVAETLRAAWDAETDCHKGLVLLLALREGVLVTANGSDVALNEAELARLFEANEDIFKRGHFRAGLGRLLEATARRYRAKLVHLRHVQQAADLSKFYKNPAFIALSISLVICVLAIIVIILVIKKFGRNKQTADGLDAEKTRPAGLEVIQEENEDNVSVVVGGRAPAGKPWWEDSLKSQQSQASAHADRSTIRSNSVKATRSLKSQNSFYTTRSLKSHGSLKG